MNEVEKMYRNAGIECDDEEQALRNLPMLGNAHYKVLVEKEALEQENKKLKKQIESDKGLITIGGKQQYKYLQKIDELEQKNKALKDNNNHLQAIIDDGRAENKRFREENKELKKDVQLFKCLDTFGENECHCACRCLGNEFCEDAEIKINKYKTALEEIRDYCKFNFVSANPILNKINECLGE